MVKSYPGNSGTFWLRVSTDAGVAGGGPAGGGSGNTGGGSGGGPAGWNCPARFYGANDGCDRGCGIRDPDCPSSLTSVCDYCSSDGSCASDGASSQCDTSLLTPNNNATCGGSATGGGSGTTGGGTGTTGGGTGSTGGGSGTCIPPDGVVISAVYTYGGSSNATYSYDYV